MKKNKPINEDESIDIILLISSLWKNKNSIIKTTLVFSTIGIIYSLLLKNIYTASSTFYPHYEKNSLSQSSSIRSLAGIAGIDLDSETTQNVPPTLYPNIINSPQFKIEILDSKINYNDTLITFREYLNFKKNKITLKKILYYPINLIGKYLPNNLSKNNNLDILQLSDEEFDLHEILIDKIFLILNEDEGFIQLNVKDNNPLIASQIAKIANDILQKNIIDFKLKNLSDTYDFISSQLKIAKKNFYILQDSLATFNDRNINIKSDLFLNQFSRIESEYLIAKNIYNELALNKEKSAIEVKKNTPIFTVIKPVVIPNIKSEPKRTLIVFIFTVLGFAVASFYTITKSSLIDIWKEINK